MAIQSSNQSPTSRVIAENKILPLINADNTDRNRDIGTSSNRKNKNPYRGFTRISADRESLQMAQFLEAYFPLLPLFLRVSKVLFLDSGDYARSRRCPDSFLISVHLRQSAAKCFVFLCVSVPPW